MSNDLYFIPIIARALQSRDSSKALNAALHEIKALGKKTAYEHGYTNFEGFMAAVAHHSQQATREAAVTSAVNLLIAELGTRSFEGTSAEQRAALDAVQTVPEWEERLEELHALVGGLTRGVPFPPIVLTRDGAPVAQVEIERGRTHQSIPGVVPGRYSLELSSGRLIWERQLTERELIWRLAFPDEALGLAADTGEVVERTTHEEGVLNGGLRLRVYPGLESGRIELEFRPTMDG